MKRATAISFQVWAPFIRGLTGDTPAGYSRDRLQGAVRGRQGLIGSRMMEMYRDSAERPVQAGREASIFAGREARWK